MIKLNAITDSDSKFKPTIQPGIHNVVITGHEFKKEEGKSPYHALSFETLNGSMVYTGKLYASEKAVELSCQKAKHMITKVATAKELDSCQAETLEGLLAVMVPLLVGKKFRFKFCGEEYLDENGNVKVRTVINRPNFAESLTVPEGESQLRYDPTNKYDFKRIPKELIIPQPSVDVQSKLNDLKM